MGRRKKIALESGDVRSFVAEKSKWMYVNHKHTLMNLIGLPRKSLFHITFLITYHLHILNYFSVPFSQQIVYSTHFTVPNFEAETVAIDSS